MRAVSLQGDAQGSREKGGLEGLRDRLGGHEVRDQRRQWREKEEDAGADYLMRLLLVF